MPMKIIIAGGTGFIGSYLNKKFTAEGHTVIIIARRGNFVKWNPADMRNVIENADVLINLAGHNINCRYTEVNKNLILGSRIQSTAMLGNVLAECRNPPPLWINASATAIYKSLYTVSASEDANLFADDFLAQVVKRWESDFVKLRTPAVRQVALRTSVVLGRNGGAFTRLHMLARLGLGGAVGSGKQMFSWIHYEDYYRVIRFIIENKGISGVVNCTSPGAATNAAFMKALRKASGMPLGIPAPEFVVQHVSKFLNFEPDLILNSSWVYPKVLLNAGFVFKYPELKQALDDLVHQPE